MPAAQQTDHMVGILRDTIVALVRRDGPDLSARQLGVFLTCYLQEGAHTVRGLAAAGARSAWRARSCPPQGGPDGSSQRARATHPQGRRIPARSALDHERGNLYLAQEQQQCWRGTSQSRARLNATARSVQSLGAFCPGDDLTESPSARQSPACDACPLGRLCNVYKPRHLRDDDRQRQ
jgi:hypothetical protein